MSDHESFSEKSGHGSSQPAMSEQQKKISSRGLSKLNLYRELAAGDAGWFEFALFEAATLFTSGLPGAVGLALRALFFPPFFKAAGHGLTIGRGVTIRQPKNIALGSHVFLDDYSVLDIRRGASGGGIEIGDHVLVGRGSIIVAKNGSIQLGNAVNISSYCRIATQSSVVIEESVLIAAYAYIGPGNHRTDAAGKPIIEQEMDIRGGVKIGAHSWIGAHSTIVDGVTIGRNAVVGAHSFVRDNVPDNAVVAGTPAKVIRIREPSA